MQFQLLAFLIAASATASWAALPGKTLTTAAEVLKLTRQAAGEGHPAELRGVVMSNNGPGGLFLHDSSGGIYVSTPAGNNVTGGDAVIVRGKTAKGGFLPVVTDATVTKTGRLPMPQVRSISYEELSRPHMKGSYVETEATVRSLSRMSKGWAVVLHSNGVGTLVEVHTLNPEGMPHVGDVVRVRGSLGSYFNVKGQWLGPKLHVQTFDAVKIVRAAGSDAGNVPLVPVEHFLRHRPGRQRFERARMQGTVTCVQSEGLLCIQDQGEGVLVRSPEALAAKVGDFVEVTGFAGFDGYSPALEDAQLRRLGQGKPVLPIAITADQARSGRYDGRLVEMQGTVAIVDRNASLSVGQAVENVVFTIGDGSKAFSAELPDSANFSAPAPGSKIRVTGVCRVFGSPRTPSVKPTFALALRNAGDITIVEHPPLWTAESAGQALTTLAVAVSLGIVWVVMLRRKVRRQTSIIVDQLHLETALEERYRDLIENATDLVFTVDVHGMLLAANRSAQYAFGIVPEEVSACRVQQFITAEDRRAFDDVLALLIGGERTVLRHVRMGTDDGRICIVEMNCRVRHVDGQPRYVEIIGRDVTQQKREQAALEAAHAAAEAASRAKSEFLANMSHEIRTPMNGILGMTELTLQGTLQRDQRANLEVVRTSAEALVAIINDVLDFSKMEVGTLELEHSPFQITPLVSSCVDLIALPAAEKGIELVCDIDPSLPAEWMGDGARLRQVLVSLAGNASKFTESGMIVVRVDRVEALDGKTRARFAVRDTGIGIPAEDQGRIFEMFSQADGSFSRKYGGAGLGLTLASRLVIAMGGKLTVNSNPGAGSTFEFTLDVESPSGDPIAAPNTYPGTIAAVRVKNQASRSSIVRLLRHAGMVVVDDGPAALTIAEEHSNGTQPGAVVYLPPCGSQLRDFSPDAIVLRQPVTPPSFFSAITSALESSIDGNAASQSGEEPAGMPAPENIHNSGTILLAEDNKVNQMLAVRTLEKGGYRVVVANNGREAVALMRTVNADIVLMDIQMPEMDGFQATAKIREWSSAPVIAMTAHALKGDRERCLSGGMTDYIAKPVRPPALLQIVARHMQAIAPVA